MFTLNTVAAIQTIQTNRSSVCIIINTVKTGILFTERMAPARECSKNGNKFKQIIDLNVPIIVLMNI